MQMDVYMYTAPLLYMEGDPMNRGLWRKSFYRKGRTTKEGSHIYFTCLSLGHPQHIITFHQVQFFFLNNSCHGKLELLLHVHECSLIHLSCEESHWRSSPYQWVLHQRYISKEHVQTSLQCIMFLYTCNDNWSITLPWHAHMYCTSCSQYEEKITF